MLTNDDYGMCGVAGGWGNGTQTEYGNGVRIMALRMGYSYNYLGQEYGVVMMDAAAEAFYYAADNGADIASCSWGSSNSGGIGAAATYFLNSGGIICVAAGNDGAEVSPDYLNGRGDCISVSATDENDNGASFTTYGTWVDICAPGDNIYSTYHDHYDPATNYWAAMGGTSMATPMVAGVVALIWSQNPSWTASQVENQLYSTADNIDAYLASKYIGKMGVGRINAYEAVNTGPPPPPVAEFSGSPTSGTEPLTVDFTDLSTGSITDWDWTFGDGGTSTAQSPSYEYTSAGTYTVSLTVTGPGGSDGETKIDYITVNPCVPPTAGFVGSPTTGDAPLTVDFTDQSTGATSWSWDFGDGVGTSSQQNPSYTYDNVGTYTVTLTATNSCGSDQMVRTDYITVTCSAPVADFAGSPTSGTAPLLVDFIDLSTGGPTGWSWDFGDGVGTSTAQNPSYTYSSVGTYTVSLTATNSCGSDIATKVDYITVTESFETKAYANADIPVYGTVSGSYTNTIASDDVYETITEIEYTGHPRKRYSYLEHKWTIDVGSGGDNMTFFLEAYRTANSDGDDFDFAYSTDDATYLNLVTVGSAVEQVYSTALPTGLTGTIYVRVLDTDRSWGNLSFDPINVDQMYIEYSSEPAPPVADFSGSPTSGSYPLLVNFTDLSTGSPTSWSWNFGDGVGTSADQNPSYTYTAVGSYTVTLTATNAYGSDNETKLDYITVSEPGEDYSHVDNMQVGRRKVGPNYLGTCTVTIFDYYNAPLANATVYVNYDGPTSGSASGVTGGDGTVVLESTSMKKPSGEWCFEVTDVTHATHTYDAGSNNVTRACESGWVYSEGRAPFALEKGTLPESFALHQNNPNPFNPTTEISFDLPVSGNVRLEIFNVLGQNVATLVDQYLSAGEYSFKWNANGEPSGVYLYRVTTNNYAETRKMVLMK
jgi:PKD repeat protein